MMKTPLKLIVAGTIAALALTGCTSDADVASENLSKAADNFEIVRRIVFYNAITDTYILEVEGKCSVDAGDGRRMSVTCKAAGGEFKKHFLGASDNVTWFAEQLEGKNVSVDHYKVVFKPSTIIPDVDVK